MSQIPSREPIEFSAGDTLAFKRSLADYRATDGWSLVYEGRGQSQPIEFSSTADGADHSITVDAATTATWLPGEYALAGFAVKGSERHAIYMATLNVLPNLQAAPADEPVQTHAQKMVALYETAMLAKAGDDILETRIGETAFKYMTPEQMRTEHGYWVSVRRNELARENARSGRPTGNKVKPMFRVMSPGPSVGMADVRSGYLGW